MTTDLNTYIVPEQLDPSREPSPYSIDNPPPCGWHPTPGIEERFGLRLGDVVSIAEVKGVVVALTHSNYPLIICIWRDNGATGGGYGEPRSWLVKVVPAYTNYVIQRNEIVFPIRGTSPTEDESTPSPQRSVKYLPTDTTADEDSLRSELIEMIENFGCGMPTDYAGSLVKDTLRVKKRLVDTLGLGSDLRRSFAVESECGIELPSSVFHTYFTELELNYELNPTPVVILANGNRRKITKHLQSLNLNPPQSVLDAIQYGLNQKKPVTKADWIAKFGELLRPATTVLTISCNPSDLLSASYGGGFNSCHRPEGEYFNGNISYCRDGHTLIGYVGTPTKKTGRMFIFVDPHDDQPEWVQQQLTYGSMTNELRKSLRVAIEKIIDPDGVWVHRRDNGVRASGTVGYFDDREYDFVYRKNAAEDLTLDVDFERALCLSCGNTTAHETGGVCEYCDTSSSCCICGRSVDDDNTYRGDDGDDYCESCFYERYNTCDRCGDAHLRDDSIYVDDRTFCSSRCAEREGYYQCSGCGGWCGENELPYGYCEDCVVFHMETCAQCEDEVFEDDAIYVDGEVFCSSRCHAEWLVKKEEIADAEN